MGKFRKNNVLFWPEFDSHDHCSVSKVLSQKQDCYYLVWLDGSSAKIGKDFVENRCKKLKMSVNFFDLFKK